MKKLTILCLTLLMLLSLAGCGGGSYGKMDLNKAVPLSESGVVDSAALQQIKSENAIAVFTGRSGDTHYEWTIFGSDITDTEDVNLSVTVAPAQGGISLTLTDAPAFPALLSLHLNEHWDAQSATAYRDGKAVASVSLTGGSSTILNLTTLEAGSFTIRPDAVEEVVLSDTDTEKAPDTEKEEPSKPAVEQDSYLSPVQDSDSKVYIDRYMTEEVPEGKPKPVEPENQQKGEAITVTFSIECATILNNLDMLDPAKLEMVPSGGVILSKTTVSCYKGESVFDVLQRVCRENGIHMESEFTPIYNSAYIEGIHNLYEFDCGSLSGWMYRVNGWYPNYGCSRYVLEDGDVVEWRYTCDLGEDVGGAYAVGGQP